jgi:hypothetical protein
MVEKLSVKGQAKEGPGAKVLATQKGKQGESWHIDPRFTPNLGMGR